MCYKMNLLLQITTTTNKKNIISYCYSFIYFVNNIKTIESRAAKKHSIHVIYADTKINHTNSTSYARCRTSYVRCSLGARRAYIWAMLMCDGILADGHAAKFNNH